MKKYKVQSMFSSSQNSSITCPFCGFEVEEELDGEPEIPEEAEHDSWN